MKDYWIECISEALKESNIKASAEQINNISEFVEGAHENYGMATGSDVANDNFISEDSLKLSESEAAIDKRKRWEQSTTPCVCCNTTGLVIDGWGRDQKCTPCDGLGRV
tara:strand:- start:2387 stop:2713 length:327 start_codon:yes stop_codon:yes gene_type:complete